MRFFYVEEPPPGAGAGWRPPATLRRHLQALRLGPGDRLLLLPPEGEAWPAEVEADGGLLIGKPVPRPTLPLASVTLATAWPKGSRADELVVRAAECGVTRILPLSCARSVSGRDAFRPNRVERWERLMRETCQQCGRPEPPQLTTTPMVLPEVHADHPQALQVALLPGTLPLATVLDLQPSREFLFYVGPEGGFDAAEESWFHSKEVPCAGLLPTVLRIEAAGPVAAALAQHHWQQRQAH